jgi:CubicO group peptidase (beta-lactamase class C family)
MSKSFDSVVINSILDRLLEPWDQPDTPGWAIAVLTGSDVIAQRCVGMASLEHCVPITPRTIFSVASLSKQMSCAATLRLADRDVLELDRSPRHYLPELPQHCDSVDLKQLMGNVSGLRDLESLMVLAGIDFDRPYSNAEVMALIAAQQETNSRPGAHYLYCNTGFRLIANIVEKVTGRAFHDVLAEEVFAPSGMAQTHMCLDRGTVEPGLADAYARGAADVWRRDWGLQKVFAVSEGAEAGVYSCLDDMVNWIRNFVDDRLGSKVLARMGMPGQLPDGRSSTYGYGLNVTARRGLGVVQHGGGMPGVHSFVLHVPEVGLGIVCLANHEDVAASAMAHAIMDEVLKDSLGPHSEPLDSLDAIDRLYVDHASGVFLRMSLKNGQPEATLFDEAHGLELASERVLRDSAGWLEVDLSESKTSESIQIWMGGDRASLAKVDERVAIEADFTPIHGRWRSTELGADYRVEPNAGSTELVIEGPKGPRPCGPLHPVGNGVFLAGTNLQGWQRDLAISLRARDEEMLVSTCQARHVRFVRVGH